MLIVKMHRDETKYKKLNATYCFYSDALMFNKKFAESGVINFS